MKLCANTAPSRTFCRSWEVGRTHATTNGCSTNSDAGIRRITETQKARRHLDFTFCVVLSQAEARRNCLASFMLLR